MHLSSKKSSFFGHTVAGGDYFAYFKAMYSVLSGRRCILYFGNLMARAQPQQHVPFGRSVFPWNRRN